MSSYTLHLSIYGVEMNETNQLDYFAKLTRPHPAFKVGAQEPRMPIIIK